MIRQNLRSNISRGLRAFSVTALAVTLAVGPVGAGTPAPAAATALSALEAATGGQIQTNVSDVTGNVDFVRATNGALLALDNATASPETRALTFLNNSAGLFGNAAIAADPLSGLVASHPDFELAGVSEDNLGQTHVRLDQRHQGLEVFGAQLVVHMNDLGITGVNGTFIRGIDAGGTAVVSASEAADIAVAAVKGAGVDSNELVVYPKGLFEGQLDSARLAWAVRVSNADLDRRVFVDALTGETLGMISERHEALDRVVYSPEYDPDDPNANVQRSEGDPPTLIAPIDNLYDFAGQVYELFDNGFDRDSYDGAGATMRSVYLINDICPNAYWNSTSTNYCPGFDADDIVAHEWGHAYTEHTHGLIYSYQSGALNESYSDIFGEIVDLNNGVDTLVGGTNNDDPYPDGQRWIIGEDLVGPAQNSLLTRDMWDPDRLSSPGKVTSSNYACGTADGGGVHTNSGVPNHAFAMLVDGQTYNGQTVSGIGFNRAANIYYRAMSVYQVPSSNFANHADALLASCEDLRDSGVVLDDLFTGLPSGETITQSDCDQVAKAAVAVEMRTPPTQCGYGPMLDPNTPPLCDGASTLFTEDFESGLGAWSLASNGVNPEWPNFNWTAESSLPEARAGSAAFAIDSRAGTCAPGGDNSGTFSIDSPGFTIPAGTTSSQVRFDHYVETELEYDGGNVLFSVNGGAFGLVPEANYLFNGPATALSSTADGNTNPKAGELAWHGADGGEVTGSWGTTIINLTGLAAPGDTVELRYDFGVDGCNGVTGWYVDNVHAYTCDGDGLPSAPAAPVQEPIQDDATPDQEGGVDRDGNYTISWTYPEADAETPCGFRVEEATAFGNLFFDDAEELLAAGANSTFAGDLEWHTEPHPDSGSNGYTAIYHDLATSNLVQIVAIDLPAGQSAILSYDSFEDIEEGYDEGLVQVSVDGGSLELVERFTGSFSGRREVDLSAYAGRSVQVAFTLVSDIYFSFPLYQGWFIDNISIDSANWMAVGTVTGSERSLDLTGRPDGTNYYRVVGLFRDCNDPVEGPISNEQSIVVERLAVETFDPTASFTATPNPAEVGEAVAFDGSASADNDAEGPSPEIIDYFWSFGDGATESTSVATTSHTYAAAGTYRVVLRVTDNDGETAFDELYVEVEEGQQPGDEGKVTGGGHILVGGEKANFGFNAKNQSGVLSGNLTYQDKANGIKIKADSISQLVIDGNDASFTAPCSVDKVDGYTCTVDVTDNGEPGSSDTFSIAVSNGYSAGGTVEGGNIQIH